MIVLFDQIIDLKECFMRFSFVSRFSGLIAAALIGMGTGLVALTFRSLNSFMRPFVQMPRGFCRLMMNGGGADCRTH